MDDQWDKLEARLRVFPVCPGHGVLFTKFQKQNVAAQFAGRQLLHARIESNEDATAARRLP